MAVDKQDYAGVPARQDTDSLAGLAYAGAAYVLWGLFPFYFKAIDHISAIEIVMHRTVWSVPVAGLVLLLMRRTADLRVAFRTPRTLAMAGLTALVVASNWGVYVWSVVSDRVVEAALGYYINPLVNVAVGAVVLGERLNRAQFFAVVLATIAVLMLTVATGGVPWVPLWLAVSFSAYAFLRKTLPIGPTQGFFLEVLILSVPALAGLLWLAYLGTGHFRMSAPYDVAMLIAGGVVTTIPLLLFGLGARLLRFTTIGLMQYLTPTMLFLLAVFVYGEPFDLFRALTFALIWLALGIYTFSLVQTRGQAPA